MSATTVESSPSILMPGTPGMLDGETTSTAGFLVITQLFLLPQNPHSYGFIILFT
jgi:hypothetical protein